MTTQHHAALAIAATLVCAMDTPAKAESCTPSQQYILEHGADGQGKPQTYRALSKVCEETLTMSNVKDAFILTSGAIAVVPRRDGISATAVTLSEFCSRFPKGTLRFVARKELSLTANIGRAVRLDSSTATSCQKIVQGG